VANTDSDDTDLPPETAAVEPKGPRKVVTPIAGPESFADRLRPHIKKIAAGAGALAVVLGLFYTWRWMKNRKAASHTGDLAGAVELGQRPVLAPDPAKPVDPTKPAPVDEKPPYPSVKARAEAVLDQLDNAGGLADADPLYHAALLMDAGRLDEAAAIYAAHAGDAGLIGVRAREGQGYAIEARAAASKDSGEQQKLLEQALTVFKTMQPDDKGARADYAHYHIGRLLAQLNRTGEAKAELDKALELVPESEIKGDITARRALVEVQ
jgi:tetratricopeptide (TPR) repeat protein